MEQWANDYQVGWSELSGLVNDFINKNPEVLDFLKSLNQSALDTKNSVEMNTERRLLAAVNEANSLGINTNSRIFYQLVGGTIGAYNGASVVAARYIYIGAPKQTVIGAAIMGSFVGGAAGFHVGGTIYDRYRK